MTQLTSSASMLALVQAALTRFGSLARGCAGRRWRSAVADHDGLAEAKPPGAHAHSGVCHQGKKPGMPVLTLSGYTGVRFSRKLVTPSAASALRPRA